MRRLVLDYAAQHHLADAGTTLVDIGWTGRMAAPLTGVCQAGGMRRPHVLFWGHEPRPATGRTDSERVASDVYNTATGQGLAWRVPDAPFATETSCTGDHGIVSGYRAMRPGGSSPCSCRLATRRPKRGGSGCTGRRLYEFCAALDAGRGRPGDYGLLPGGRPEFDHEFRWHRPRSFTSTPCALAHSRTSVVFSPPADPLRSPRAGRRAAPPTRRAAPT